MNNKTAPGPRSFAYDPAARAVPRLAASPLMRFPPLRLMNIHEALMWAWSGRGQGRGWRCLGPALTAAAALALALSSGRTVDGVSNPCREEPHSRGGARE